jgi:hypothetical protein
MNRRGMLAGAGALIVALAAGAVWTIKPFRKHYAPTPYDDLLSKLDDRDWAARFGAAAQRALPDYRPQAAAVRLHGLVGSGTLKTAALRDAGTGRLVEVKGWLVPESVALIAALAKSNTKSE